MKKLLLWISSLLVGLPCLHAQALEIGMETVIGPAYTTFRGDLGEMLGIDEIELTDAQVDTALARIDVAAPRWLKELYPGVRIEVDQEIVKKFSRTVSGVRFYARVKWFGGSFTISSPRLTEPQESKKLKNQIKAIRLSLGGKADALAEHLALVALADADRVSPFFEKRYDLEGYLHLKKVFLGEDPLVEWGSDAGNTIDLEVTAGFRLTADPSPVVDLGSALFISEKLDSLMEGGILKPVEGTTDKIAESIQAVVFGRFKDPRIVPSMGWFLRGEVPVNFGGAFSVVAGTELSIQNYLAMRGIKPSFSIYGFAGLRWRILGEKKRR